MPGEEQHHGQEQAEEGLDGNQLCRKAPGAVRHEHTGESPVRKH